MKRLQNETISDFKHETIGNVELLLLLYGKGHTFGYVSGVRTRPVSDAAQDRTCTARAVVRSGHRTTARATKKN